MSIAERHETRWRMIRVAWRILGAESGCEERKDSAATEIAIKYIHLALFGRKQAVLPVIGGLCVVARVIYLLFLVLRTRIDVSCNPRGSFYFHKIVSCPRVSSVAQNRQNSVVHPWSRTTVISVSHSKAGHVAPLSESPRVSGVTTNRRQCLWCMARVVYSAG